jgi:hypothetical protein
VIVVLLGAVTWDGKKVPATFTATTGGSALSVVSVPVDACVVPDGVDIVTVVATPTQNAFHSQTVEVIVEPTGTVTPVAAHLPYASSANAAAPGVTLNVVTIVVSRLRDVSDKATALLAQQPNPLRKKEKRVSSLAPDFPPATWTLPDRDAISFVDVDNPVLGDIVATVERDLVGGDFECAVFEIGRSSTVPKWIAVSWPLALLRSDDSAPTPFLLYYHPGNEQNVPFGFYRGSGLSPYPENFDYAYNVLYKFQWYTYDPVANTAGSKGIPFQIAVAGKDIASVIPCNIAGGNEFGEFMKADFIEAVLLDLQALMFRRAGVVTPPSSLGRTALAAFSSGNVFLGGVMASAVNRQSSFLTDTVREVYLFDPPDGQVESSTTTCLDWAAADQDRRIALYTRGVFSVHDKLLGEPAPKAPYVRTGAATNHTSAVLPIATLLKTVVEKAGPRAEFTWQDAHQLISALMLTHAVSVSDF